MVSETRRTVPGRGGDPASRRLALMVLLGTVPTVVVGLLAKPLLEKLFASPRFVAAGLALTGLALWAAQGAAARRATPAELTPARALLVGLAQGVAVAPGISRSGARRSS